MVLFPKLGDLPSDFPPKKGLLKNIDHRFGLPRCWDSQQCGRRRCLGGSHILVQLSLHRDTAPTLVLRNMEWFQVLNFWIALLWGIFKYI